jgi:hypothetical protein
MPEAGYIPEGSKEAKAVERLEFFSDEATSHFELVAFVGVGAGIAAV